LNNVEKHQLRAELAVESERVLERLPRTLRKIHRHEDALKVEYVGPDVGRELRFVGAEFDDHPASFCPGFDLHKLRWLFGRRTELPALPASALAFPRSVAS
jgi:hypothetical protein